MLWKKIFFSCQKIFYLAVTPVTNFNFKKKKPFWALWYSLLSKEKNNLRNMSSPQANKSVLRFLNEPRNFSGETSEKGTRVENLSAAAITWLNRMDRIRVSAGLNDEDILLVAGDHLIGKAEIWWNVLGCQLDSWVEFAAAFRKQYAADREDQWWYELSNLKQGVDESIDDLSLRMRELLVLVGNQVESFQVRVFLGAIHPHIACEIEKRDVPRDLASAIKQAKKIEHSLAKYGGDVFEGSVNSGSVTGGNPKEDDSVSTMSVLIKELEQLRINVVQLQNERQRGSYYNRGPNLGSATACFYCKEEGHRRVDCPKLRSGGDAPPSLTGGNAVPLGGGPNVGSAVSAPSSGKGQERQ